MMRDIMKCVHKGRSVMVLFPAMLVGGHLLIAVVDQVPDLNFQPLCRDGAPQNLGVKYDSAICMHDESTARDQLAKAWSGFAPADRARCIRMSTMDRTASYVEVLTCLEMDLAAKKMHQGEDATIDAGSPAVAPAREKTRSVRLAPHPAPVSPQPPEWRPGPLEILCLPGLKALIPACQR
jgi:hypothetical protein